FGGGTGWVLAAGTAAVMWLGGMKVLGSGFGQGSGFRVQGSGLTVGDLLVLLSYLASLYAPLETLSYLSQGFATASAGGRRVVEVLDTAEEVREIPHPKPLAVSRGGGCNIVWEHVTFGYNDGTAVLNDVTLEVAAGQMLALVGPTGAGKS